MRPERYGEVMPPAEVMAYAGDLPSVLVNELDDDLVGVYLHGSAVLGGFHPAASDVDVLAVTGTRQTGRSRRGWVACSPASGPAPAPAWS